MLPRTLEPEVMDEAAEVAEYDAIPHDDVNTRFVEDFLVEQAREEVSRRSSSQDGSRKVLDLGTGTALIPLILHVRQPGWLITAVDQSETMLAMAKAHLHRHAVPGSIELIQADVSQLPFEESRFDAVFSNSLIHHLADPLPCLQEALRVLKPGGLLFVRDLFRPSTEEEVEALVEKHAAGQTPGQRQLLRQSLHASLTVPEMRELLTALPVPQARITTTSDRHWTLVVPWK